LVDRINIVYEQTFLAKNY